MTLTTQLSDDAVATATVLDSGDIEIELRDRAGVLLAKGWLSVAERQLSFTILRTGEGGGSRGEVRALDFDLEITLENAIRVLVAQWLGEDAAAGPTRAYDPYAPGCHVFVVPVETPGRNHCVQNCCAMFDQVDYRLKCVDALERLIPERYSICARAKQLYAACIATCGLMPERESYGAYCMAGEHKCFDERCGGEPGTVYCAKDCFREASPCDDKPEGSFEFCNEAMGARHNCEDGNQRFGYWAPGCDTTVASCDCRDQSLWRCSDDRCAAGRNGFCAGIRFLVPDGPELPSGFECDKRDVRNPCCGDADQPCCEGNCTSGTQCKSGMCKRCGGLGEPP